MLLSVKAKPVMEGSGIIQPNLEELRSEGANGISQRSNQMWDCGFGVSLWNLRTKNQNLHNSVADLLTQEKTAEAREKSQ